MIELEPTVNLVCAFYLYLQIDCMEFPLAQPIDSVSKFWKDSLPSFTFYKVIAFGGVLLFIFPLIVV